MILLYSMEILYEQRNSSVSHSTCYSKTVEKTVTCIVHLYISVVLNLFRHTAHFVIEELGYDPPTYIYEDIHILDFRKEIKR